MKAGRNRYENICSAIYVAKATVVPAAIDVTMVIYNKHWKGTKRIDINQEQNVLKAKLNLYLTF